MDARIENALMKTNCKNESITVLQLQKVILHLLKKEFLLSDIQMKKLTDLIERLEKYEKDR